MSVSLSHCVVCVCVQKLDVSDASVTLEAADSGTVTVYGAAAADFPRR